MTNVGSSLVTNATRKKPALWHHLDYTIYSPELRSVDFTAASYRRSQTAEVDATDVRKQFAKLAAVAIPWCRKQISVVSI